MKTSLFDFELPDACIAQHPAEPRDSARMLVVKDPLNITNVSHLPDFLKAGDLIVFNNSKVIPARLFADVGGKEVEILLHKRLGTTQWQAFAKPGKKLKIGSDITFASGVTATVEDKLETGEAILSFKLAEHEFLTFLEKHGSMPLPPYIRDGKANPEDTSRYQTIYAEPEGSVAAPTAGLHFTERLMDTIKAKGVQTAFVTLHVGAGTFQPVKVEDTTEHKMHTEYGEVSAETALAINAAKKAGGRIICVGTTSLRLLESAADSAGVKPWSGDTGIFITPGYQFKTADILLTNFHLPKSTLFMLVSAFAGLDRMQAAYKHAIAENMRFYSYGDATLLYRAA